jgi:hypothetical protein
MHKNEFYDREYIEKLEKIIDKFFLRLELNSYEYEYLNHYHNIVFAKIRNLKNLICDFPVDKNEKVYYKYENVGLYKLQDNVMLPIQKSGEIFITTKKILLNRDISIYPIDFETIVDYKVSMRGLEIYTKHNIYILKCYDDYLIYTSLERIFKLQGIKL